MEPPGKQHRPLCICQLIQNCNILIISAPTPPPPPPSRITPVIWALRRKLSHSDSDSILLSTICLRSSKVNRSMRISSIINGDNWTAVGYVQILPYYDPSRRRGCKYSSAVKARLTVDMSDFSPVTWPVVQLNH